MLLTNGANVNHMDEVCELIVCIFMTLNYIFCHILYGGSNIYMKHITMKFDYVKEHTNINIHSGASCSQVATAIGDLGCLRGHRPPFEIWVVENLKETLKYVYIGIVKPSIFNTLTCHFYTYYMV